MPYRDKTRDEFFYLASKRNIAHYYRKEIQLIANGEPCAQLLPQRVRKRLKFYYILEGGKGISKVNPEVWRFYAPDPELYEALDRV